MESMIFGATATPFNTLTDFTLQMDFENMDDAIKEPSMVYLLVLVPNDPAVCFGRDGALVFFPANDCEKWCMCLLHVC